jgi:hypothetical protein
MIIILPYFDAAITIEQSNRAVRRTQIECTFLKCFNLNKGNVTIYCEYDLPNPLLDLTCTTLV